MDLLKRIRLREGRRVLPGNAPDLPVAVVLLSGLALGLLAALGFAQAFPFPPADYSTSGVVGWVTLNHYPKSRELVVYAVSVLLALGGMLFSVAVWLAWVRRLARRHQTDLARILTTISVAFLPAGLGLILGLLRPRYAWWWLAGTLASMGAGAAVAAVFVCRRVPTGQQEGSPEAANGTAGPSVERPPQRGLAEPASVVFMAGLSVGFFLPLAVPASAAPRLAEAWWLWPPFFLAVWLLSSRSCARRRGEPFVRAARRDALAHAPVLLFLASPFLLDFPRLRVAVAIGSTLAFVYAKTVACWLPVSEAPRWALPACRVVALATFAALWASDPNYAGFLMWPGDSDHILSWLNEGRHGKWLYRDFWFPYGPLMYLLDFACVRLCGLDRYLVSSAIVCSVLVALGLARGAREVCRTWPFQVIGSLFLFFAWPPNAVTLRVYLGLAALVWAVHAAEMGRARLLAAAGAFLGVTFLYSHEVVIAVLVAAPPAIFWAGTGHQEGPFRRAARALGWMTAGLAGVLGPVALAAAAMGLLESYLRAAFGVIAVADLCCGAPYPSLLRELPAADLAMVRAVKRLALVLLGGVVRYFYLPPLLLALGVAALAPRIARGERPQPSDAVLLGLVGFGLVLFRVALGRSEEGHARFATVPSLVIAVALLERLALAAVRATRARRGWLTAAAAAAGFGALALGIRLPVEVYGGVVVGVNKFRGYYAEAPRPRGHRPVWGWSAVRSHHGELFFFPDGVAGSVEATRAYLQARTQPGEGVFAFPYAFRYNVLLDRPSPLAFGPALWGAAARRQDRRRLVAELASRRVRYVVYDDSEWADLDGVAWTDRFPEVAAYIFERYEIEKQIGPVSILRYREGSPIPPPSAFEVGRFDQRLHLLTGWYAAQAIGGKRMRWTSTEATARLTRRPGLQTLFIHADVYPTSPPLPRRLFASIDGRTVGAADLSRYEGWAKLQFPLGPGITEGPVVVRLEIERPVPATDLRRLGLLVDKIGFE